MADIDRDAPLRFLHTAYEPNDWVAVFLKSYETGQTAQRVRPVARVADARFQAWLRWRNLLRWNVYVSLNAVAPDRRSRARDAVVSVRHVFLDIDHDGPRTLAAIGTRKDVPPPSYVLESSPNRFHVFWRVSGFTIDAVEALQKYLATELHSDPAATPCTQTTRLPGFVNHKGQLHVVTIEYRDVSRVYTPGDFPVPTPPPTVVMPGGRTHHTARGLDRVERARRYLMAVPPAITGQHGDLHTFRVCCRLVRGFALSDIDALALLVDWNARCQPPWSARELQDKLRRARRYGREPIGGLLSEDDQVAGGM